MEAQAQGFEEQGTALILDDATVESFKKGAGEDASGKGQVASRGEEPGVNDLAKEMGWNPNYKGADAVDAATYIRNTSKMQKQAEGALKVTKQKNQDLEEGFSTMRSYFERQRQKEVGELKDRIKQLESERVAAIREGDVDMVASFDDQIGELHEQVNQEEQDIAKTQPKPALNPAYVDWKEENTWYGDTENEPELNELANAIATKAKEDGLPLSAVLKKIDREARSIYPEKFGGSATEKKAEPREPKPLSLTTGRGQASRGDRMLSKNDLTEGQRRIMEQAKSQGMPEDVYLEGLTKQRKAAGI